MTRVASADGLGDLLVSDGLVSRDQLERAWLEVRGSGGRIGRVLVKLGFLGEHDLALALARQHRVATVDLERVDLDAKLLKLVPAEFALRHLVVPLRRAGRTLTVAISDPGDGRLMDDLKFITRFEIEPVIAGETALRKVVERAYAAADERIRDLLRQLDRETAGTELPGSRVEEPGDGASRGQVEDAPVVKLIDGILNDAVARRASDIHFECYEKDVRVRYRIDGVLQEIMRPPAQMKAALISRFKILADLNIAERRLPQDGRIKLRTAKGVVDFRVATLPTLFGEKIVLRILDGGNLAVDLEALEMEPKARVDFLRAILNPQGLVLVTGRTGSGKTTTLYSALSKLNTPERNILTAEDPIEYNLRGINQLQVRPEIGMTFAAALRAFLRQDPNVIMVGEIRDGETGSIAIKAALTGHLVLSTLHTNDAPSTITRMVDMGIEPFNVAAAVTLITAQRLVRRICSRCREEVSYPAEYVAAARLGAEADGITYHRGAGCEECGGSGYRGRQGLYEVMAISPALRRMILQGAPDAELRDQAVREGMLTLRMDGLVKIRRGVTTLEEVLKETSG
jgi:type IV pilus assembly protein PilB